MSKEPKRNIYVGHRYVPKIMGEWNNEQSYESLSIVTHQGTSYTSKKHVPAGVDILDEEYWVVTGNYNAQVEHYRQEVRNMGDYVDSEVNNLKSYVNSEINDLTSYVNSELNELQADTTEKINNVTSNLNETKLQLEKTTKIFKDFLVNVKDFGAVGDGETDDTDYINEAFSFAYENGGTVYFPKGTYLITNTIGEVGTNNDITINILADEGAKITVQPSIELRYALRIQASHVRSVNIKGLEIDCNHKARTAIYVMSIEEPITRAVVENCNVYNMHGTVAGGTGSIVTGIHIQSANGGGIAEVRNNSVIGVTREAYNINGGNLFCSGITVTMFNNVEVKNNYIEKVLTNSSDLIDADGIKVFSSLINETLRDKSTINIENNNVIDCAGRFVKLQTYGKASVRSNLFEIKSSIELIHNFSGVDSQVANADIEDNHFYFTDGWTGAGSGRLCSLQSPNFSDNEGNNFYQSFSNNKGTIEGSLPYGIVVGFHDTDTIKSKIHFKICENEFFGLEDLNTTNQINLPIRRWIYSNSIPNIAGNVIVDISRNKVFSYDFIYFTGTTNDLTEKLYLIVEDNIKYPDSYNRVIINDGIKTSSIRVRNNKIGGVGGDWRAPFDILKIMSGSTFAVSSSTVIENKPAGFSNGIIINENGFLQCYSNNGLWLRFSGSGDWNRVFPPQTE